MSNKLDRWMRSKAALQALGGALVVLLVVVVVGQFLGWWATLGSLITGTAVQPPPASWPAPDGGYSCFPPSGGSTCNETDGKFISMPGEQMHSFGGASTILWVSVPGDTQSFELGFFDGDAGKDDSGSIVGWRGGNWDNTTTETTYTLYADPLKDGSGDLQVGQWLGNQDMPNNAWHDVTLENVPQARGPSGHYFYRLEATRPVQGQGINAFKLRSTGYLGSGHAELVDASFAIVGMVSNRNDVAILYPEFDGDYYSAGPSTYTGEWQFYFRVPTNTTKLELWDGDFDRGTSAIQDADTDDPNTEGTPPWASPYAVAERAGGRGFPADNAGFVIYRREPPVRYEFTDPDGEPIYTNEEPSGTEEWERFLVSTDPGEEPDLTVDEIEPGFYGLRIEGLDVHNTVWLRLNYEVMDEPPPPNCDATCPRTIGYWKNNVKKVLIEGRTNGVQETQESLEGALRLVALESVLFRHGVDVCNPRPVADPSPLTAEEAHMILQRDKQNYAEGCDANSMLARALQQTLATWLNWGSGKICDETQVELDVYGGLFADKIERALAESQDIILNGGDLERAKDIGDQINNGNLGEDADLLVTECDITDPDDQNSAAYRDNFPPDKQPPRYGQLKKAPKKDLPDQVETGSQPDPETCEGVRVNQYNVESPTSEPFYGIKFEFQSGTEVKDGDVDAFQITLTQEQAAAMGSVQMEAKAGTNVGQATLMDCAFAGPLPCGEEPVQDENGFFVFAFMGAHDNGDGTLTLTFHVQNMTGNALSHATIGLPDGVVPSAPSGSYESRVCPPQ
jgi:hypothetical protein